MGFAGSQNLIEPSYNKPKNQKAGREWVELMSRVEGPVVAALNAVFLTDWYTETEEILEETLPEAPVSGGAVGADPSITAQVVPSGPGFVTENNLRMFTTLLYSAQRRISITSPYFVPDESLLYAVTTAAQRNVDVELFVSEVGDQFMVYHAQRSYYQALLEAGVRIYLYPAPYVLHAKHFTVDDDVAVIGSSNMDLQVVRPQLRGERDAPRSGHRGPDARGAGHLPLALAGADTRGVGDALAPLEVRRQRHAAHVRAAVAVPGREFFRTQKRALRLTSAAVVADQSVSEQTVGGGAPRPGRRRGRHGVNR